MDRCPWAKTDLYVEYHDSEWGVPVHDDRLLFEFLILEGMQAGLSWETVLRKRDAFRRAFARFEPAKVARFTSRGERNPGRPWRSEVTISRALSTPLTSLSARRSSTTVSRYLTYSGLVRFKGTSFGRDPPDPPGNADEYQNKGVMEKAIRKYLKTKDRQNRRVAKTRAMRVGSS